VCLAKYWAVPTVDNVLCNIGVKNQNDCTLFRAYFT
jgi:hypothetical protein